VISKGFAGVALMPSDGGVLYLKDDPSQIKHQHSMYFPFLSEITGFQTLSPLQRERGQKQFPTPKWAPWCPIFSIALDPELFWLYILFQMTINFFLLPTIWVRHANLV
jgi:hypothetical protein